MLHAPEILHNPDDMSHMYVTQAGWEFIYGGSEGVFTLKLQIH